MSDLETHPALADGGGALRDPFNPKDEYYVPDTQAQIPTTVDLRKNHHDAATPIYDQGSTQSCTANAAAAAFWYEQRAGRHSADWGDAGPSRLFIYWLARGGFDDNFSGAEDNGSYLRDAIKGIAERGACPESDCQFPDFHSINAEVETLNLDEKKAIAEKKRRKNTIVNAKPPAVAFEHALAHKITTYWRLDADRPDAKDKTLSMEAKEKFGQDTLEKVKKCLSEGFPVAFSFWYYLPGKDMFDKTGDTFILKDVWNDADSSDKGVFPRHTWIEDLDPKYRFHNAAGELAMNAHSVLAIGYDDAKQEVLVQNSLGPTWGGTGVFLMPYAWISDFAATNDFWTIRVDEEAPKAAGTFWEELNKAIVEGVSM